MWVLEMMWVVTLMAICGNNMGCNICDIGGNDVGCNSDMGERCGL